MIALDNIQFKYPKEKGFTLENISLRVVPGEIFTLLGPNGAGKTTLIRIMSGLILPLRGTASICGYDVIADEYNARRRIGLVLGDERTFYFRLSGAQNLEFFGGLHGIKRSALKHRVAELLYQVGLEKDAKLQFMRYSTGMRKRLNMARALLHEPQVLLLDEPNSGVDPASACRIRETIFQLREKGRTVLLTTHDMTEAERLSDRIGFIRDGRLTRVGSLDDFKRLVNRRKLVVTFSSQLPLPKSRLRGLIAEIRRASSCEAINLHNNQLTVNFNGSFNMNKVLSIISRDNFRIDKANTYDASLEDVFMTLAR